MYQHRWPALMTLWFSGNLRQPFSVNDFYILTYSMTVLVDKINMMVMIMMLMLLKFYLLEGTSPVWARSTGEHLPVSLSGHVPACADFSLTASENGSFQYGKRESNLT
jgi:hypothetical protein